MSLFSPRGGRDDNYDWTLPSKYLSLPIGLTLYQVTRTWRRSLSVRNQLDHGALEKLICHDCSMGSSDKAETRWYYTGEAQSERLQSIYHGVICGRGILPVGPDSPGHAWMYGADSGAGCHPSGLINEELGPVFNVFNMGR